MIALAVLLSACARSTPDRDQDLRSAPVPNPSPPGLDAPPRAGADDSGGTKAPPPTPPAFPCPDPPAGAVVLHAGGYLGDLEAYHLADGRHLLRLYAYFVTGTPTRCLYAPDFTGPAVAGDAGAYVGDLRLELPLAYPSQFEGGYSRVGHPLDGRDPLSVGFEIGFWRYESGVRQDWSTDSEILYTGDATLCLSRLREDRVSGTLTYRSSPSDPRPAVTYFMRFNMVTSDPNDTAAYDDGTCFHETTFGIDPADLWTPGYDGRR